MVIRNKIKMHLGFVVLYILFCWLIVSRLCGEQIEYTSHNESLFAHTMQGSIADSLILPDSVFFKESIP